MTKAACAAAVLLVAGATMASAQTVSLTMRDGRVSLTAENASVRQILAEWERLGQVKIVGADKLAAGAPLTITLTDVPERQALDIVLRAIPGYMVVDRAVPEAALSRYDRLVLMPRTTTPVMAAGAGSAVQPQPRTPVPQPFMPQPAQDAMAIGQPEREDVEQFAEGEPVMPTAPVINPYPGGAPGPYGGSAAAAGAAVGVNPPETQFDYANPQAYFERMRQAQQQQAQPAGPTAVPGVALTTGTGAAPGPTAVPTAPGALARPGIAPVPTQPPPAQGQFFNPYNLPPDYVPPQTAPPAGPPVEPDRAKYANPYVPNTKPPQQ